MKIEVMNHLRCNQSEFQAMEKFTETHYINGNGKEYPSSGLPSENILDNELAVYSMWPYVYSERNIYSIPIEDERIPAGEIAVRRGADVNATDGHIGQIDEFVIDPQDGHITHLLMQKGHLWEKKKITLPLSKIERMDEDTVYLKLDKKTVRSLPAVPIKRFYSHRTE